MDVDEVKCCACRRTLPFDHASFCIHCGEHLCGDCHFENFCPCGQAAAIADSLGLEGLRF